jgi:hypothetical protein
MQERRLADDLHASEQKGTAGAEGRSSLSHQGFGCEGGHLLSSAELRKPA